MRYITIYWTGKFKFEIIQLEVSSQRGGKEYTRWGMIRGSAGDSLQRSILDWNNKKSCTKQTDCSTPKGGIYTIFVNFFLFPGFFDSIKKNKTDGEEELLLLLRHVGNSKPFGCLGEEADVMRIRRIVYGI